MEIPTEQLGKQITTFLARYSLIIFFIVVMSGLIICTIVLNSVVARTDQADGYVSNVNNISFDQTTINRVQSLKSSDQETDQIDTSGRLLPF